MEVIQKILLSALPVYFYFVPNLLFPRLYKIYIKKSFYNLKGESLNAGEEINELDRRVSRLVEFISFLSITVVTLITIFYSKEANSFCFNQKDNFMIFLSLLGLFVINIIHNINRKFLTSKKELTIERITILIQFPIIYLFL